ncbi:hypothetical protein [Xanthomonas maliensis]|uniref:hypothetical protein n=1 Tax=Xanthomonas maliensis TaxID=1321368 RepID=UPI001BADDFB0|nr:hypothetical protein [Xanthomonas maliensis]
MLVDLAWAAANAPSTASVERLIGGTLYAAPHADEKLKQRRLHQRNIFPAPTICAPIAACSSPHSEQGDGDIAMTQRNYKMVS